MALPEYVKICPLCEGYGYWPSPVEQCHMCRVPGRYAKGQGYIYPATVKPVPDSVLAQIENTDSK